MSRTLGTIIRGIRAPIVKEGDDVVSIVVESIVNSTKAEGYSLQDRDIIGVTESIVARSQGNYASVDDIARDLNQKYGDKIGVVFPILSRNRFSILLKGIAATKKEIHILLSYPSDEVGNHLMDVDKMIELGLNPYADSFSEDRYRELFSDVKHPFTGIDYVEAYKSLGSGNIYVHFSNDPTYIFNFTKDVLVASIHDRHRLKGILKKAGANVIHSLDEVLSTPSDKHGYNEEYGLLGTNIASETQVKLFPRNGKKYVDEIQKRLVEKTGKKVEVLIYGDGAFKDPVGKIWELADPVVSPAYTDGLCGMPNELKLKFIADTKLGNLRGDAALLAMKQEINEKDHDLMARNESVGTTPRHLTDLIGSLCDLTSGSGDKGTPVILIQGYFDNLATE